MFIIAAVVVFVIGFILYALEVSTGHWSLLYLGLALFAAHFLWAERASFRRRG